MSLEDNEVLYKLMQSLDNDDNANFVELTSQKIKQIKNDRLQELQLPREKLKEFHRKLHEYRYVESIDDIQYGQYIRWIPLNINSLDDVFDCGKVQKGKNILGAEQAPHNMGIQHLNCFDIHSTVILC